MMKKLNKIERPLLTEVPKLKELTGEELKTAMTRGIKLIDARNKADFASGFIPGSINIQEIMLLLLGQDGFCHMTKPLFYWLHRINWMI